MCPKWGFFIDFLMILAHFRYFFIASSTATATATVAPTIGLFPDLKLYFLPSQNVSKNADFSIKNIVNPLKTVSFCVLSC
jgi:hypothetical protein